jgi:LacI family transcriptional regulator
MIPQARRNQILRAAKEMGYRPNPMGVGLARFKRSSKTVPVRTVLAWVNFWPEPKKLRSFKEFELYWQGASTTAEKLGYHLEEFVCNERLTPIGLEKILVARGIQGILIPPQPFQPNWGHFRWECFSTVRIGRSMTTPITHLVTADHVANTIRAVDEIRARGYRRIGFVGYSSVTDRRWLFDAGFLRAQLEMSRADRLPILTVDRVNAFVSQPELTRWLKKEKPDAVLTECLDLPAMLKKSNYRILADIGVAAMSVLDGKVDTGIDQNPEEIGRAAILMLISLLHDNSRGIPPIHHELLVKGKWVDGSTLPRRR